MGENSEISWTHHTFNPWIGCTKVAAGCAHCYAEVLMDQRYGKVQWGPNGTRVLTSPSNWAKPLKWNRDAERAGVRARVFCASLADVFEDWKGGILTHDGQVARYANSWGPVGIGRDTDLETHAKRRLATMDDARSKLFKLIDETPWLDWLLLTKRPENIMRMMFDPDSLDGWVRRENLWLGTSIATQADADKNIPEMLKCRDLSPVLFLSMEPLLGPVRFCKCWLSDNTLPGNRCRNCGLIHIGGGFLDWVIVGGESGHDARPMHPQWARSIRDQCQAAGVPFHFKQHGEWSPESAGAMHDYGEGVFLPDGRFIIPNSIDEGDDVPPLVTLQWMFKVGKKRAGRMLDGRTWDEFPSAKAAASV